MNPFEQHYQEDLEQIQLHGATFHVKLPSTANRRFQRAVLSGMVEPGSESVDDMVVRRVDLEEMVEIQVAAFARTCIRRVEGWDDYSTEKLLSMPDACEDLWAEVVKLTNEREGEAQTAVKKSETTSDGSTSGPGEGSSMPSLKAAGH